MYDPFTVKTMPGRRRKSRSVAFDKRIITRATKRVQRMQRHQVSNIDFNLVAYLMHFEGLTEQAAIKLARKEGQKK